MIIVYLNINDSGFTPGVSYKLVQLFELNGPEKDIFTHLLIIRIMLHAKLADKFDLQSLNLVSVISFLGPVAEQSV